MTVTRASTDSTTKERKEIPLTELVSGPHAPIVALSKTIVVEQRGNYQIVVFDTEKKQIFKTIDCDDEVQLVAMPGRPTQFTLVDILHGKFTTTYDSVTGEEKPHKLPFNHSFRYSSYNQGIFAYGARVMRYQIDIHDLATGRTHPITLEKNFLIHHLTFIRPNLMLISTTNTNDTDAEAHCFLADFSIKENSFTYSLQSLNDMHNVCRVIASSDGVFCATLEDIGQVESISKFILKLWRIENNKLVFQSIVPKTLSGIIERNSPLFLECGNLCFLHQNNLYRYDPRTAQTVLVKEFCAHIQGLRALSCNELLVRGSLCWSRLEIEDLETLRAERRNTQGFRQIRASLAGLFSPILPAGVGGEIADYMGDVFDLEKTYPELAKLQRR
jgi:hypothetical protein